MADLTLKYGKEVYLPKGRPKKRRRFELWGWILFVVSALFFIFASLRTGDVIGLLGGIFFLLACLVFLTGYIDPEGKRRGR